MVPRSVGKSHGSPSTSMGLHEMGTHQMGLHTTDERVGISRSARDTTVVDSPPAVGTRFARGCASADRALRPARASARAWRPRCCRPRAHLRSPRGSSDRFCRHSCCRMSYRSHTATLPGGRTLPPSPGGGPVTSPAAPLAQSRPQRRQAAVQRCPGYRDRNGRSARAGTRGAFCMDSWVEG